MDLNSFMMLTMVLLTEGTTAGIDISIVDALLEVGRTILNMFTIFPLNVFLTGSIVGLVIGIVKKLKKASK